MPTLGRRSLVRGAGAGALLLACRPALAAPRERLRALRERMQRFVDEGVVAGVVTMVGQGAEALHLEAVGLQDLASRRPMRTDAIFRIASMTKPVTALALMMLSDEGKVSVTDPVEKHLPEFRGLRVVKTGKGDDVTLGRPVRPPTIADLLTHTSGMASLPPPGFAELYAKRDRSLAEAVVAYSQRPLEFEPGARWSYSNPGIDTVGRIVEALSGRSFERFCDERIFRPLGMRDTHFYIPAAKRARLATLYKMKDGALQPVPSWLGGEEPGGKCPVPAGGLLSTAADLGRLHGALVAPGRARLVRPETLAEMTRVHTGDLQAGFGPGMGFGLGFAVVKQPQGATGMLSPGSYGHGGAFGTQGWIDPARRMYFVLLVQRDGTPGGDQSELRKELQRIAVEAIAA